MLYTSTSKNVTGNGCCTIVEHEAIEKGHDIQKQPGILDRSILVGHCHVRSRSMQFLLLKY